MAVGKGTLRATFHLANYAAKMARFDDAPLRKRTAARGAEVVEVRAGDRIVGFSVPWDVPRPVETSKPKASTAQKKPRTSQKKISTSKTSSAKKAATSPKAPRPRKGGSSPSGTRKTPRAKK
jgi:hypothetical protein